MTEQWLGRAQRLRDQAPVNTQDAIAAAASAAVDAADAAAATKKTRPCLTLQSEAVSQSNTLALNLST